jgi:hypothetical protein
MWSLQPLSLPRKLLNLKSLRPWRKKSHKNWRSRRHRSRSNRQNRATVVRVAAVVVEEAVVDVEEPSQAIAPLLPNHLRPPNQ